MIINLNNFCSDFYHMFSELKKALGEALIGLCQSFCNRLKYLCVRIIDLNITKTDSLWIKAGIPICLSFFFFHIWFVYKWTGS